jgi:flagellar biosynthetic protein FliR
MNVDSQMLLSLLNTAFWPFVRISALLMTAPVLNGRNVPARIKLVLAASITALLAPTLPAMPDVPLFSPEGVLLTAQQVLVGALLGFVVQMVFDAMVIAGETAAMSMGLGFATFMDPERGVAVPVLSQFLLILTTLTWLALDGHLALLDVLATSFRTMPVAVGAVSGVTPDLLREIVDFGATMFAGALRIALPAVCALLIVNIAFGVISRAAPTLNMFAVGFPVSLVMGFGILLVSLPATQGSMLALMQSAYALLAAMTG